jgi:hypothetical protein
MSSNTMSFALPEALRELIEEGLSSGPGWVSCATSRVCDPAGCRLKRLRSQAFWLPISNFPLDLLRIGTENDR